jgi:hypothetical protein
MPKTYEAFITELTRAELEHAVGGYHAGAEHSPAYQVFDVGVFTDPNQPPSTQRPSNGGVEGNQYPLDISLAGME